MIADVVAGPIVIDAGSRQVERERVDRVADAPGVDEDQLQHVQRVVALGLAAAAAREVGGVVDREDVDLDQRLGGVDRDRIAHASPRAAGFPDAQLEARLEGT